MSPTARLTSRPCSRSARCIAASWDGTTPRWRSWKCGGSWTRTPSWKSKRPPCCPDRHPETTACRWPGVGALTGTVAGAGAVIAAACDVRIAAESAKIAFLFTKVGLSGADMGAAWLLPRIVGLGHATELLMTGDFIDAQTALRIGLYNRVVAHANVMGEARGFAERVARGPSVALRITKDAPHRGAHMDLVTALEAEAQAPAGCMLSPNFRAAYEAFKAKREPRFV